jgi:hypothetical protein
MGWRVIGSLNGTGEIDRATGNTIPDHFSLYPICTCTRRLFQQSYFCLDFKLVYNSPSSSNMFKFFRIPVYRINATFQYSYNESFYNHFSLSWSAADEDLATTYENLNHRLCHTLPVGRVHPHMHGPHVVRPRHPPKLDRITVFVSARDVQVCVQERREQLPRDSPRREAAHTSA